MNNHSSTNDRVLATQRNLLVTDINLRNTVRTSRYVTQVTDVPSLILWASMLKATRIEVSSSADTTVRGVSKLMDMEAVESFPQTFYFSFQRDWGVGTLKVLYKNQA